MTAPKDFSGISATWEEIPAEFRIAACVEQHEYLITREHRSHFLSTDFIL